ncbi:MAG: HAD-IC family P-type ATPase, partial [Clostridia bacterium]|nr:HAD-IC family P-type ATPase [Clostridia bacterium]
MKFYTKEKDEVLNELKTNENGLSSAEAERRLLENGKNRLKEAKGKSIFRRFLEQLIDPMIIILIVAALISGVFAVLENESFADVIIILAVVLVNAILGVYQESKAEKAIEALQKMSAATSKVLRDGRVQIIPSEDLVVGDIIMLEAGDAVPADARIIENASLKVEEAAITGESVPVTKFIDTIYLRDGESEVSLGDRKNMLYMGTTVVYGRGVAVVTATGMDTQMGQIAGALAEAEEGQTPLQKKLAGLSKTLTWIVLGICITVFGVQLIRTGDFGFDFILSSFMVAVSLAVAAIPEGLAAVVTVVLSMGVTNMSRRNAIIRKLTAVETLGCAQIICSDKTGTLTQNKMTVVDSFSDNEVELACGMALCSDAEIDSDGNVTGEPTEAALVVWANKLGHPKYDLKSEYRRIGEAPFDSNRKMMSTVHASGDEFIQYTKGAPDVVIGRCAFYQKDGEILPMTDEFKDKIILENKAMA